MSVAIFGGTFDPVHMGHLSVASELAKYLSVQTLKLVPCALPPHRDRPSASAVQRMDMLQQATIDNCRLTVDNIELHGSVPSYSINTVHAFRQQMGNQEPLFLCMGSDVLCKLDQWYQWQELLSDCHIVVVSRPDALPVSGSLANWVNRHHCEDLQILQRQAGGKLHLCRLTMLDISSTLIRAKIKQSESIGHMVPKQVIKYIEKYNLYK